MRALIIMPLAERRGGAEVALSHLMWEGRGQEVEWIVLFLEDGPMVQEFRNLGVDARELNAGRLRHLRRYARTVWSLRQLAKETRADVVFSWMAKAHLYGGPAAALAGVPAVWYQHGIPASSSWIDRLAALLPARGVIATSKVAAAAQARIWPTRNQRVVYPGVSLNRFDLRALPAQEVVRQELDLPTKGPLIGFLGRLQRWKGVHVVIESMPRVLAAFPHATCVIVGGRHELEPGYSGYLSNRIAELHMEQHVRLVGFQSEISKWMHAVDVVVLPSDNEPFGITVVEAMALGKPVIAGASGGPTEIITPGRDGLLVASDHPSAVSDAILILLGDDEFASSIGVAARQRAQQFGADRYARNLIEALTELVTA
jgi:glycosyltransferase involved in cell wall biosynthesis